MTIKETEKTVRPTASGGTVTMYERSFEETKEKSRSWDFNAKHDLEQPYNGHAWVDLGLSVKWAKYNLADESLSPMEGRTNFFAWGQQQAFDVQEYHSWKRNEPLMSGPYEHFMQGKPRMEKGKNGEWLQYPATPVTALWGRGWRMPTKEEWVELIGSCSWVWTDSEAPCPGYFAHGPNGNHLFFPALGFANSYEKSCVIEGGQSQNYWTCSYDPNGEPYFAYLDYPGHFGVQPGKKESLHMIRPVLGF